MVSISKIRLRPPCRLRLHKSRWLLLALLIPTTAQAADARPSPHRHIPAKSLIAYFEFDGLDAHADAWKGTAACAALTKTKAGAMIGELAKQVATWLLRRNTPLLTGADVNILHEHLSRRGFAFAVYAHGNDVFSIVLVFNDFGNEKLRPSLAHAKRYFDPFGPAAQTHIRGRDVYQFEDLAVPAQWERVEDPFPLPLVKKPAIAIAVKPVAPWLTVWFEGNDLIVVGGPSESIGDVPNPKANKTLAEMHLDVVAAVLDATDGKQPNVETHLRYKAAIEEGKDLKDFEPAGLFFMRLAADNDRKAAPAATAAVPNEPLVDKELRHAAALAEELPPVFTEKDLQDIESLKHKKDSASPGRM